MNRISLFGDDIKVALPVTQRTHTGTGSSSLSDGVAALQRIKAFMSPRQSAAVADLMRGEEGNFFIDKMVELDRRIAEMPVTYAQRDQSDPIAYLHYFIGGSDWYIVEKDMEGKGTEQAWGFACLNGDMMNAEYGFISIDELASLVIRGFMTVDLDFHFDPTPMSSIKCMLGERHG